MKIKLLINWKAFTLLLCGCIFGVLAVLPFVFTLQADVLSKMPIPSPAVIVLSILQNIALFAVVIFIGLSLGKKVDLGVPLIEDWIAKCSIKEKLKTISIYSIKFGVLTGLLIIGFDYIFSLFIEPITAVSPPIWQGFLASFYGGITEEILIRLFFMTLLVWLFSKLLKTNNTPTNFCVWLAIVISAILFGLGHLPTTALLTELTLLVVIRAIFLNGVGGIIFGWLYWKKGLESAMIAHFSADIVLHVIFPLFLI